MITARKKKLPEPDRPYDLFFPDTIKDQLAKVKKKDKTLCEQLKEAIQEATRESWMRLDLKP